MKELTRVQFVPRLIEKKQREKAFMSNIKLFESKQIRSVWNETELKWYFSVQDVVEVLTDTVDVKDYIKKMKKRDFQLNSNWGTICPLVEMEAADGKRRKVQAATAQGLLRIIQSIPSPKAEPFKLWLAQVGSDRLDEIENPELATQRTRELYKLKGHPDDWIEKRMRSIAIREELTDEWKTRGVKEQKEYAILTAEISKATFGLTPAGYKKVFYKLPSTLLDIFHCPFTLTTVFIKEPFTSIESPESVLPVT